MNAERWLDACREGCAAAVAAGATAAEAFAQHTEEVSAEIEKGDLQVARSSRESTLGIRVLVGDRVGFASTNSPEDLASACRDAVALAKAAPGDSHNRFPEAGPCPAVAGLFDEASAGFAAADVVRCAAAMLAVAASMDRRVVIGDGGAAAVRTVRAVANTHGVAAAEAASLFTHHVLVTAREGDQVSSMDFQYGATRRANEIDVTPAVTLACRNALDSLGSSRGATFRGVVLLSPSAVLDLLVAPLLFQVNARNALRGLTRWRDRLGERVAAPAVSLVDDATLPGGVASSSFDREGTPRAALTIIDRGRLASLLHNAYSSQASAAANTGHAEGSAGGPPLIGPTNLAWLAGDASLDDQIADTSLGLFVARFAGNVDPISGDFSGVAKAAHLVRGGRRVAPVNGCLVAGNVFEALDAVLDASRERQKILGFTLPFVRVGGISVTAG